MHIDDHKCLTGQASSRISPVDFATGDRMRGRLVILVRFSRPRSAALIAGQHDARCEMRRADEIDGVAHRPRVRDAAGAQPNPPSPDALGARHRSGRRVRGVTDLLPQWFRGRAVADRGPHERCDPQRQRRNGAVPSVRTHRLRRVRCACVSPIPFFRGCVTCVLGGVRFASARTEEQSR